MQNGTGTMARFTLNGRQIDLDADPQMPALWLIREELGLTGTKFGCGIAQCGACTVHINGLAQRACVTPLAALEGASVTTIEGLKGSDGKLHPLQQAWIDQQVPQCGYCQSGQLMSAAALLAGNPNPSDAEIDAAMRGNICRCGMYDRIRSAIKQVAQATFYDATAMPTQEPTDHG
jgi:isoquinoline 1-oxidoreductase alpha subunit